MLVSEISYGNWITHGSQVEEDAALACVRAALDCGITTFDTADVYAGTRAEAVLGRALKGERREGLEIFTKVFWPTGPGRNDRGLSRKHMMESINNSLRRLQTDTSTARPTATTTRRRWRYDGRLRRHRPQRKGALHRRFRMEGVEIRAAHALAQELRVPLVSSQPQYFDAVAGHRGRGDPHLRGARFGQIV